MFPRLGGAWRPSRRVALAAVPAAFGALLFLAGDRPPAATSRLEATHGVAPAPPSDGRAPVTTAAIAPATTGPEAPPTTLGILGEALAAALAGPGDDPAAATAPDTAESPPPAGTALGSPTPAASDTEGTGAPATAESRAAPGATSGETSSPAATSSTATTATTATATTTTTAPPPAGPEREPGVEAEVVPLTNADRSAAGLVALSRNGCLDAVASRYARDLALSGVLAHNPEAGAAVRECRPNSAWGDNVGTATPCSAAVLEERWMASPSHRRNILTGEFRYIGVGAWTDAGGACWVQVLFSS